MATWLMKCGLRCFTQVLLVFLITAIIATFILAFLLRFVCTFSVHIIIVLITDQFNNTFAFTNHQYFSSTQPTTNAADDVLVLHNDMRTVKVGFHYPSSRPEFTGRELGPWTGVHFLTPVNSARVDGCQKCTWVYGPSRHLHYLWFGSIRYLLTYVQIVIIQPNVLFYAVLSALSLYNDME